MSAIEQTRASLLARLGADVDRGVWIEFFDRYGELIHGCARASGLQPTDSDDVVQDVIAALIPAMKGFRYDPARGSFRAYLRTAVANAVRRVRRRADGGTPLHALDGDPIDPRPGEADDARFEQEWRRYHVRRALRSVEGEVAERDRTAFTWYVIHGRAAAEVAEELGMTLDQVYQVKTRLLKRLGAVIERQRREEG